MRLKENFSNKQLLITFRSNKQNKLNLLQENMSIDIFDQIDARHKPVCSATARNKRHDLSDPKAHDNTLLRQRKPKTLVITLASDVRIY